MKGRARASGSPRPRCDEGTEEKEASEKGRLEIDAWYRSGFLGPQPERPPEEELASGI